MVSPGKRISWRPYVGARLGKWPMKPLLSKSILLASEWSRKNCIITEQMLQRSAIS